MQGQTILIIEDNEMNMELVADYLEIRGFSILKASDAETGIGLAQKERPDLILMDIGLPGIDGLQATQRLKEDPNTQSIPIVILTASAMGSDAAKAELAGADGFVTKPVNVNRLVDMLRSVLKS